MDHLTDDEDFLEVIEIVRHPRRPQVYRERPNHFEKWRDHEFMQRFRISKDSVRFVVDCVSEEIASKTNRYILFLKMW